MTLHHVNRFWKLEVLKQNRTNDQKKLRESSWLLYNFWRLAKILGAILSRIVIKEHPLNYTMDCNKNDALGLYDLNFTFSIL